MLAKLQVADSIFIGYVEPIKSVSDAKLYQESLKKDHPLSAHIPYCWISVGENCESGFEEDGEPADSVGPILLEELQQHAETQKGNYAIAVVRYFGNRLLGVSCGRLSQCYRSVAARALLRYFQKEQAIHLNLTKENLGKSVFGLGAGDCEIILDILKDVTSCKSSLNGNSDPKAWVNEIIRELEFDGFRGNQNEELPRLQNLQADISKGIVPCYRYPGNYRGDEWETYQWSPLSYQVKKAVEKNLGPFSGQEMNHCVTNYYRDGSDYIGHHSDKDLDLDKDGVIVSVSLGDERILELKKRDQPQDSCRVILPHGSMLVLGPLTNKLFTHSILPKEGSVQPRISLTFRSVLTFLDKDSGLLFGEGVETKTLSDLRTLQQRQTFYFVAGLGSLVSFAFQLSNKVNQKRISTGVVATGLVAFTYLSFRKMKLLWMKRKEEQAARIFFSNASVHGTKY